MKSHLLKVFLKMSEYSATLLHEHKVKQITEKLKTAPFKPNNFLRLRYRPVKKIGSIITVLFFSLKLMQILFLVKVTE